MKNIQYTFFLFLVLCEINAQVGIGTETPDESAILEVSSVEKGFLPPRMDTSERNNILNPAEGLVIFNTDENCLQFYNTTGWYNSCDGAITGLPIDNGGECDGEASIFTFEGVQYKPIESSGNCWLDRNLGANRVASASDDEDAYGYLYL